MEVGGLGRVEKKGWYILAVFKQPEDGTQRGGKENKLQDGREGESTASEAIGA